MATKKKKTKLKSLSASRPHTVIPARSISSKATRTLIRSHHTLEKQRAKALTDGDGAKAETLRKQIEAQGGLENYQRASLLGQSNDRGGDSSRVLVEWLAPVLPMLKEQTANGQPVRMLEVGALSVTNACSKSRLFNMERIDLNSQAEGITQQDFMERPLPLDGREQFDIISLSLVLNYVPDAMGKGEMLLRVLKFLDAKKYPEGLKGYFASVFLVLPAPCVTNSRYMDEGKMEAIMVALGFVMVKKKLSTKLVYYLWRLEAATTKRSLGFKKEELRSGKTRNNFSIVLK
ncbi:25S rRNA adenine-N(1) methyltransferase [Lachnellula suecica]|uniref:25S rRNA adenine-N(1) methyltransferase n=1 Tax=Lachnellula suecica TaxID=602035 RepID=A0A8T9BXX3_9HELO|nr:25S rRNA adenine-N(1) methyltransferase [Lachnellula suecica]